MAKKDRSALQEGQQAVAILQAVSRAVEVPGRRVVIERKEGRWLASLDACTTCAGSSLSDALAQLGTVINSEVAP